MEPIVKQIHRLLIKKQITIALAESCTGGLLSKILTDLAGSSQYFILGIVAYSNLAKEKILGISLEFIRRNGAVSQGVAQKMAQSARKIAQADFSIGITGIAGPTGGTPQKPVGEVFIAIDSRNKKICKRLFFKGLRSDIRRQAALKALQLLHENIYRY